MGFSDKIILFDSFNEPLGIDNNTPTLSRNVSIKLDDDQEFTFARIFFQLCGPALPLGYTGRVEFNGNTLGSISLGPFESGCESLDIPVTDIMNNGKNTLKIHLDARLQSFDITVYADLFYILNTDEGPSDVDVSDPEKDDPFSTTNLLKIAAVISIPIGIGLLASGFGKGAGKGITSR